jgi:acyl-CoA dehydrogenase-like protein
VQMGRPIREHPLVAEMVLDMQTTVAGLRALWMEAAVAYDLVEGLERRLHTLSDADPEHDALVARKRRLQGYLRELTPLAKYYGAEEAIRVARTAMQVFGGYGVVKEYEVERFLRDSLILPIYEGTSQIQALMATKDLFKVLLREPRTLVGPAGFSRWLRMDHFDGTAGHMYDAALHDLGGSLKWLLLDLARQIGPKRVAQVVQGGGSGLTEDDLAYVLLSAERLTQMLAHVHIARLLLQQARRWPARRPLAERFARRAADVCHLNARRIRSGDRAVLQAIDQWRAG